MPAPGHVAILHLEGFKTCAKHGPSRHKTRLWAFTALPLLSQVTANTLPCSASPVPAPGHVAILHLEGFKTCAKHGPSRHKTRLWAFTALPLPSQVTAHTLPCSGSPVPLPGHVAILHLEGFKTCAKHGPSRHKTRLWAFTALPLLSQVTANTLPCLCQRLASRHTQFRGFQRFQNVREAQPITTQNPSVGHYHFAAAFPSHREHIALQRQPFASAWLVAILHVEGFKTCAKHGPSGHKTRLSAFTFAAAFPGHRTHVDLQRQPCASAWPCRHNPCTALPLLPPATANTLPCSGSPLPALGHVAISPYSTPSI